MSIIHSISNKKSDYSIYGNKNLHRNSDIALIVLNKREKILNFSPAKYKYLEMFNNIISVESSMNPENFLENINSYSNLRYILLADNISFGEQINIAASEIDEPYFCIVWNDSDILFFNNNVFNYDKNILTISPNIKDLSLNYVNCIMEPKLKKNKFCIEQTIKEKSNFKTLAPFNFMAVYNKELFFDVGGFDPYIEPPFWQLADFGFRAYLYGYKNIFSNNFIIKSELKNLSEYITKCSYYKYFALKNFFIVDVKGKKQFNKKKKKFLVFTLPYSIFKNLKLIKSVEDIIEKFSSKYKNVSAKIFSDWDKIND